mgnify:CR=1 FL=1
MVSYKKGGMRSCCGRRNRRRKQGDKKTKTKNPTYPPESNSDSSDSEFTDFLGGIDDNGRVSDGGYPFPSDLAKKKEFEEELEKIMGNLKKNKRKSKKKRKRTIKRKKRKSKKTKRRKK